MTASRAVQETRVGQKLGRAGCGVRFEYPPPARENFASLRSLGNARRIPLKGGGMR